MRVLACRLLPILILAMTGACSTARPTYVPDGRRGFVVSCEGYLDTYGSCLVNAGKACGGSGYEIIRGGENDRSLLIACTAPR